MRLIAALGVASVFLMGASATAGTTGPHEPTIVTDTCSVCHGDHGISPNAAFPDLAAQTKDYLKAQIQNFKDHSRGEHDAKAFMWSIAGPLSDKEVHAIATYYSAQTPPKGAAGEDRALVASGAAIFKQGVESENVPACGLCHGPDAAGTAMAPRLAGQHRLYLVAQLKAFRSNARNNAIMHGNVEHMTDEQMREVSAYLASL